MPRGKPTTLDGRMVSLDEAAEILARDEVFMAGVLNAIDIANDACARADATKIQNEKEVKENADSMRIAA